MAATSTSFVEEVLLAPSERAIVDVHSTRPERAPSSIAHLIGRYVLGCVTREKTGSTNRYRQFEELRTAPELLAERARIEGYRTSARQDACVRIAHALLYGDADTPPTAGRADAPGNSAAVSPASARNAE